MSKFGIVFTIIAALLVGFAFHASASEPPAYLKDGTITVTLKNGKTYTFSTNEYMVVKRGVKAIAPEQAVLARQEPARELKRNRVRALGGVGPNGFETSRTATHATINSTRGAVGGVGYDRLITDTVSVSGQALTNETYTIGVGLDF